MTSHKDLNEELKRKKTKREEQNLFSEAIHNKIQHGEFNSPFIEKNF